MRMVTVNQQTLNIIGNGFDLYHGLPTSYYYFACYLLANDETFYDELANMYGFSTGIMHQFSAEQHAIYHLRRIDIAKKHLYFFQERK